MVLKLVLDDEVEFDYIECQDCGYEIAIPEAWSLPYEIDRMICSSCWAVRAKQTAEQRKRESHHPAKDLPPMTPFDPRVLIEPDPERPKPKREQLLLFKK